MRILFISQVFWPDTASVAQHLWDLAEALQNESHEVTAYSSRFGYENTSIKYKKTEKHYGVHIERINHTSFGKSSTIGRIIDFFTFNVIVFFRLLFLQKDKYDIIIGTTVPPLLSYIGLIVAKWKKVPFYYWAMDMQPELAIASNMIRPNSVAAKFLTYIGNYTIRKSTLIFALDHYMKDYLVKKGANEEKVHVLPVWPVMDQVYNGTRAQNSFRFEHSFGNKIVIMYSGNHAYVHPLYTLLEVALELKNDDRFIFVFVGGGVRKKDVVEFKKENGLNNIIQLPYQPRNNIHNSLGSADLQVVIMGDLQVGFTHPNKVYGALFIGKPIIYIGPDPSHITDILTRLTGNISVAHGQSEKLTRNLIEFAAKTAEKVGQIGKQNMIFAQENYSPEILKAKMISIIEENGQTQNFN